MSLPFGDGAHAGWTVVSLQSEGGAPRYQVEKNGQEGTLTWYPFTGPYGALHQQLAAKLRKTQGVSHPNLVPTDVEQKDQGVLVIQPETSRLGDEPMGGADACRTLKRLAEGLLALHSKNLVHGELDPLCVVRDSDGAIVLQPPGLRLAPPGVKKLGLEVDPRYAAPEVLDGLEPTTRSDMFSMGLILFRLLSGKPPVPGADPSEAFAARGKTQAPDLTAATSSLKAPVLALYKKLTALRSLQRPKDAQELIDDLSAMIDRAESPSLNPLPTGEEIQSVGIGTPFLLCLILIAALGYFVLQARSVYTTESPAAQYKEFVRPQVSSKTAKTAKTDAPVKTGEPAKTGAPAKTGKTGN